MLRVSFLLIVCALAAAESTAQTDFSIVRFDGIGPVRIGMSLSELNKTLHTSYTRPTESDEQACFYVEVPNQPGIGLMILDGRVARIDVDDAPTRTAEGIRTGDSELRALEAYSKRLKVEPDFYDPENSHYLTLLSSDRKLGIRFETTDGKIKRFYAGTSRAISFVEGCA
jgi:hypothetical protein